MKYVSSVEISKVFQSSINPHQIYFVEYLLVYGYITVFSFSKIEIKRFIVSYEVPSLGTNHSFSLSEKRTLYKNGQRISGAISMNAKSNHFYYNFLHLQIAFSFLESNGIKS